MSAMRGEFKSQSNTERFQQLEDKLFPTKKSVCICQIIKDEQPYIEEWIEYHTDLGIEKFYLIEDIGSTSHKDILSKYPHVELYRLMDIANAEEKRHINEGKYRQSVVYDIFRRMWYDNYDFLAFIDVDEFIDLDREGLARILKEGEDFPIIILQWKNMTASGHIHHPNNGEKYSVVDTYKDYNFVVKHSKMIFNCKKKFYNTLAISNISHFPHISWTIPRYDSGAYLRHYLCKSFEEWVSRLTKKGELTKAAWNRKFDDWFEINEEFASQKEDLYKEFNIPNLQIKYNVYKKEATKETDTLHYDYLIVGAGLYGLTCARLLTNKGFSCLVIDKRSHIGGNCYSRDYNGIEVHEYGPHIFHTSNEEVWRFVNKYAHFRQFELKVCATDGKETYSLPFSMFAFSQITDKNNPEEVYEMLKDKRDTETLEEQAVNAVGKDVYEKLIKGYTEKQWGKKCTELPASIIKRLPVRYSFDNNYFDDEYQGLPHHGYTALMGNILKGDNADGKNFEGAIDIQLGADFLLNKDYWMSVADKVIYCGSVDELLNYELGELSWRSLRFEQEEYDYNGHNGQGCPILNNANPEVPYMRSIDHLYFDREKVKTYQGKALRTYEYPEKWDRTKERYYPNGDDSLYGEYVELLHQRMPKICLGGRIGLYRYMDMDDTITAAMDFCNGIEKPLKDWEHYNERSNFCKIWIVGTNKDDVHINDNHLYYNAFITKEIPSRQNINPLNRFLSEFVAMWYVWKNNIYSEYVGFCHYRRMIEMDNINWAEMKGSIQFFNRIIWKDDWYHTGFPKDAIYPYVSRKNIWPMPAMIREDMTEYLQKQTIIPQETLKDYCTYKDSGFEYYNREIFFCEWEVFCDLMQFINGYVDFVADKYHLKTCEDWRRHISEKIISFYKEKGAKQIVGEKRGSFKLLFQEAKDYLNIYNDDEGLAQKCNQWRAYSYIIEDLVSIYIGTHKHIHGKRIGA